MLQDIEKIKVQYLVSLLFDLFEILQAVRSKQLNFVAMATQTGIIGPYSKTKDYCFLTISKSVSPIFLQNLILRAVAIKLYCSKLHFEHCFCLNNRCFVFSTIENNFDSGCHSNKI